MSEARHDATIGWGSWDRFWFAPASVARSAWIRGLLCLITAAYFVSAWTDAAYWYTQGGPFSVERVATFLRTAGLDDAATWIVSPLFLAKSAWVYHVYLLCGIVVSLLVAAGRGGRFAPWVVWLLLIGWANREMILSGLSETALSLGLFAAAFAPPAAMWKFAAREERDELHWRAGFSQRLLAAQVTVVLVATFCTMLGGRVWFNGLGAYALAAPAADRTIDWTNSPLVDPNLHETLTHLMVMALPLGIVLAWVQRTRRFGKFILLVWCASIALLGSLWLYALTIAVMVLAIEPSVKTLPDD